jgi:hypothetical protein
VEVYLAVSFSFNSCFRSGGDFSTPVVREIEEVFVVLTIEDGDLAKYASPAVSRPHMLGRAAWW